MLFKNSRKVLKYNSTLNIKLFEYGKMNTFTNVNSKVIQLEFTSMTN